MWWLSSSPWVSGLSCSSSEVIEPSSSLPAPIQWLRFILLSPCPQRLLSSAVDLLFLIILTLFALHKLCSSSSSSSTTEADIRKPLIARRTVTRTTGLFKTTVVATILLSFCSIVLCVLAFTTRTKLKLVDALFWLIHAVTYAVIAVLVLHEKRFASTNHPLTLRIYWVSSFIVTTLFAVSGILHLISGDPSAASLRSDDVASFVSFPLTAVLLIVSIRGSTGIVTTSSVAIPAKSNDVVLEKSSENVSLYATASFLSKTFWIWMNPLLSKGYKSPLSLDQVPTLSPEHRAEKLAALFESKWPKPQENSRNPVRTTLLRCFWKEVALTAVLAILRLSVIYVGPVLIQSFVDFTSGKGSSPSEGYYLVLILLVAKFVEVLATHQFNFNSQKLGMLIRSTLITALYKKGLKLTGSARQNHGVGQIVKFEDPLFRTWYQDLFIYSRGDRVTGAVVSESVHSYAPEEVYSSARAMESSLAEENLKFNLSWSFTVDSRFHYLIRLHFCEVAPGVDKSNQRVFSIFLNSATAEPKADIVEWSGGQGLALHRDYIVDVASYNRISVDLHPNEDSLYYDAILNGLEIFKLNTSDGNLAGPNPLPSPPVTPQPHKFKRVTPHRLKKALIIAGLVLSAVVVLGVVVAVAAAVTFKYRHRRTAQSPQPEAATACCRHFSLAEVEAATENFHESRLIGVGGFGKVYRGQLDGGDVAIKRATPKSNHDLHQVLTEIETLSKLRHRHLVSLTGCCEEDGELILIYDFMSEGTLKDHLHGSSSNVPLLPWKRRVEICIGAARGLHYLHTGASQTIVHRDVKSTNILLDQNFVAKVSDFGLAKYYISRDNTQVISNAKGTVGYMDPEYYGGERLTVKSDIYAFGIVLLEALCARPAVDVSSADQRVSLATWAQNFYKKGMLDQMVDPRLKGDINSQSLKKFAETAINCVRRSGVERPSTAAVLVNLELALKLQEDGLDRKKTICRESDMDSDVHEAGYSRSSGRSNGSKHFDGLSLRHVFSQILKS